MITSGVRASTGVGGEAGNAPPTTIFGLWILPPHRTVLLLRRGMRTDLRSLFSYPMRCDAKRAPSSGNTLIWMASFSSTSPYPRTATIRADPFSGPSDFVRGVSENATFRALFGDAVSAVGEGHGEQPIPNSNHRFLRGKRCSLRQAGCRALC